MKKLKDCMLSFGIVSTISALLLLGIYRSPSRIVQSESVKVQGIEKRIRRSFDGSLRMGNLIDEDADGIADYYRAGIASRPNGGEFRDYNVSDSSQKIYQEAYKNSKFSE